MFFKFLNENFGRRPYNFIRSIFIKTFYTSCEYNIVSIVNVSMFFICCDEENRTPLQDLMKVRHQSKVRRNGGGTGETRTHDLLRVEQTLSPLSYDSFCCGATENRTQHKMLIRRLRSTRPSNSV